MTVFAQGGEAAPANQKYVDEALAVFADRLEYRDVPEASRKIVKRLFLDTVGVALGARDEAHVRQAAAFARLGDSHPEATIWGSGDAVSVAAAAFANGVAAHGIDFDDTHRFVHPGCAVVSAAMAVAQREGASGEALLTALAAGYETSIRVAYAGGAAHTDA